MIRCTPVGQTGMTEDHNYTPDELGGRRRGSTARWAAAISVASVVLAAAIAVPLIYLGNDPADPPLELASANGTPSPHADLLEYCLALVEGDNLYVGTRRMKTLVRLAGAVSPDNHVVFMDFSLRLAGEHLRAGDAEEAVRVLTVALEAEERDGPDRSRGKTVLEDLAIAHLKLAELDNCVNSVGRFSCILPLGGSTPHRVTRGSTGAIDYLTQLLEMEPENVRYRWLLNIAHMTLGTYPEGVPDEYLVDPDVFQPDHEIGRFDEIGPESGIYDLSLAGGAIVDDFDNDGLLDIVTSTWDPCGQMVYHHNDGNGSFSDRTVSAGLEGQLGGLNLVQADYDNDGWLDILVIRGGWLLDDGRMRMSLLRNNGDGTFDDVTHAAGLAQPAFPSQSAAWADYDGDGDLDLFSCNESVPVSWAGDLKSGGDVTYFPSQLFDNRGDGTFLDVADAVGVTNQRYCKGSVWGDYDNDGDPDLYVSNFEHENRLYRNDGDGTFTNVARELGVVEPIDSFATWFWDYDNDGWLDLFVAGYGDDIGDVASDYMGIPNDGATPRLYRNDGGGGFVDVTERVGLDKVHLTMGANFGDLDGDGFPDLYLGTGFISYDSVGPNVAYRNDGGRAFQDVTFSGGFGHLQKGHGVAFGDLDRDGDEDIFVQMGGFFPGDAFLNALYENPGHGNRWLSLKLVGTRSNYAAIGARVKVTVDTGDGQQAIHALVTSGGSFGASSLEQEIGLGQADRIVRLEVRWPASGTTQVFDDVPLDTRIEVKEDVDAYTVVPRPPFRLAPFRSSEDAG